MQLRCGRPTGDEVNGRDTRTAGRGIHRLGDRYGEQALGGVAVVWREDSGWQVEDSVNFRPNVARLLLTSGSRRWYVIGDYIPPNDAAAVAEICPVTRSWDVQPLGWRRWRW